MRFSWPPVGEVVLLIAGFRTGEYKFASLHTPHSVLRTPHSVLRSPHSALRSPHSALRSSFFALRSPFSVLRSPFFKLRSSFSTLRSGLQLLMRLRRIYRSPPFSDHSQAIIDHSQEKVIKNLSK